MSQQFIAISPSGVGGYYGLGESKEVAKTRMKEQGGNLTAYIVFELPEGAEKVSVDMHGRINWMWAEGADQTGTTTLVFKRGVKVPA